MARPPRRSVGRRGFLKDAAAGAAALVAAPALAGGAQTPPQAQLRPTAPPPSAGLVAAETTPPPPRVDVYTTDRPGSDFMVDVLKSLGFEYVAANPGSIVPRPARVAHQLRRQQEPGAAHLLPRGVVGGDGARLRQDRRQADAGDGARHRRPAARVDGDLQRLRRPRAGLHRARQHRSTSRWRRSDVEWTHSVQDAAAMVRDYTKWDDTPVSLDALRRVGRARLQDRDDAAVRPGGASSPTPCCRRKAIAAADRGRLRVPKLSPTTPPAADAGAVAELAKMLVAAENPRDRRRPRRRARRAGMTLLVELAELLQAPVHDGAVHAADELPDAPPAERARAVVGRRRSRPRRSRCRISSWRPHALTPVNRFGMESRRVDEAGAKIVTISSQDLLDQEQLPGRRPLQRGRPRDCRRRRGDAAGADRSLPATDHADRRRAIEQRGAKLAEAQPADARARRSSRPRGAGTRARFPPRGCRPSSGTRSRTRTGRSCRDATFISNWPLRLWDFTKHYQFIGWSGAYGIGYGAPAAVGAALANRKHGRLSVNIQCDGDLNYAPGGAVDRGASPHSAADGHAQQPRLPPGADVRHRHGRAREPRRQPRRHRQRARRIRTSTTRRWPRPTASTARGRSTTRTISGRR